MQLHHLYRATAWLGEALGADQQAGTTGFAPRCVKDRIEELLLAHRQMLFSGLDLVFFDTTSVYFEGQDVVDRVRLASEASRKGNSVARPLRE